MQSSKRYCAQHSKCAGITRSEQGKYLNMFIKWHQGRQQGNFWACNERRPKLSTSPVKGYRTTPASLVCVWKPYIQVCPSASASSSLERLSCQKRTLGAQSIWKGCTLADSIKRCLHSAELFSCLRLSILAGTIDSVRLMMTDTDHSASAADTCDQAVVMPNYLSQSWK